MEKTENLNTDFENIENIENIDIEVTSATPILYNSGSFVVGGRTIQARWWQLAPEDLEIIQAGANLSRVGTNASFFGGNLMTAIHLFNGNIVRSGGNNNFALGEAPEATRMSCMFQISSAAQTQVRMRNLARTINDVGIPGELRWAIGGINLLLNENISSLANLIARWRTFYSDTMVDGHRLPNGNVIEAIPGINLNSRARTFIAHHQGLNRIYIGVMSSAIDDARGFIGDTGIPIATNPVNGGASYFEMHSFLRNFLGCTMGMALDGGGSSRIRRPSGTPIQLSSQPIRSPLCQLAIRGR